MRTRDKRAKRQSGSGPVTVDQAGEIVVQSRRRYEAATGASIGDRPERASTDRGSLVIK